MAKMYKLRRASTLVLRQRNAALLRQLVMPPDLLRASYVERFTTCGKSNCACDQRCWPIIPTRALSVSLFLGALLRVPSLLQLQQETGVQGQSVRA